MAKHLIRKRRKTPKAGSLKQLPVLSFLIGVVIPALLITVVVRTFLLQPFYIPSGSMHPTLVEGDQLLITKFSYGISRHSFPFAPNLFEGKILAREPERGDVVVFRRTRFSGSEDWIKRVIGLPGDTVEMRRGRLWLNGNPITSEQNRKAYRYADAENPDLVRTGYIFTETLPSGVRYNVLDTGNSRGDNFGPFTVPSGTVFVLGDNRDNSQDSRFIGPINQNYLLGSAFFIHFSYDWHTPAYAFWRWPKAIRFERFFQGL